MKHNRNYKGKTLSDLGDNIKCGNSLIGSDIYDYPDLILNDDEMHRINYFDWDSEFPEVMDNDGFDAVMQFNLIFVYRQ